MIKIEDGIYFSRWWFATVPGGDFMAALFRGPTGGWIGRGRFRWYIRGREHDPDAPDRKNWFERKFQSEAEGIAGMDDTIVGMKDDLFGGSESFGPIEMVMVGSDREDEVMRILAAQPWFHVSAPVHPSGGRYVRKRKRRR